VRAPADAGRAMRPSTSVHREGRAHTSDLYRGKTHTQALLRLTPTASVCSRVFVPWAASTAPQYQAVTSRSRLPLGAARRALFLDSAVATRLQLTRHLE
jgi:hypothetical protein